MDKWIFESSEILEVKEGADALEIKLAAQNGSGETFEASLNLRSTKAKKLPKPGKLTDGEVFGIPGKPLDGRMPFPFVGRGDYEVELSVEDKSVTIFCKEIHFTQA